MNKQIKQSKKEKSQNKVSSKSMNNKTQQSVDVLNETILENHSNHPIEKQKVNLVDLKKLTKGKDYMNLSKEEQLEICRQMLKQIFPDSSKK